MVIKIPKKFMSCVSKVSKKIKAGELPAGSSAYAICRSSTGYYGTTHDIGMIHKKRKR